MRAATVENDMVTNVIVLPDDFDGDIWNDLPVVLLDPDSPVSTGWLLVDGAFIEPDLPAVEEALSLEARFESFLDRVEGIPPDAPATKVRDEIREAAKQARVDKDAP